MMINAKDLLRRWNDDFWWKQRFMHRVYKPLNRYFKPQGRGVDVMEERDRWDNLLILDACRADYFQEIADLNRFDEFRVRTSPASSTPEWLRRLFVGREFGDTVYVTANPHVRRLAADSFHRLIDIADPRRGQGVQTTVPPEKVAEHAREAQDRFPNKRLIVHFIQPHKPYLVEPDIPEYLKDQPFRAISEGYGDNIRDAYRETLHQVLDVALTLGRELGNRSIVTADHGELLGDRLSPFPISGYAHVPYVRHDALVRVPWGVLDGPRRCVETDEIRAESDAEIDQEFLEALGYA